MIDRKFYAKLMARAREDDFSDELERLLEAHHEAARKENREMLPRPKCCEAMRLVPAVYASFEQFLADTATTDAIWRVALNERVSNLDYDNKGKDTYALRRAFFCPYCGIDLPKLVRKAKPPSPLQHVGDDDDYCKTCNESNDCVCYPALAAFKIVK